MGDECRETDSENQPSKQKIDLRVLKTRRAIREAFTQLLAEKPFENITVQDIIDRALVNRKTFYNHYHDKYDLAEQVMLGIGNDLRNRAARSKMFDTASRFKEIHIALREYRSEVLALWDVKTSREESLSNLLTNILKEMYLDLIRDDNLPKDAREARLEASLYAALATASLKFILESSEELNLEALYRSLTTVAKNLLPDDSKNFSPPETPAAPDVSTKRTDIRGHHV